jgi:transcriptional regulator with XRE-family HTH domain
MDRQAGPVLPSLVLGARLRRLREQRGISRQQAGAEIRSSESKINRMEMGRTGFKLRDIADLCTLYGVIDHAERADLLALARQANLPPWWQNYSDVVPDWFEMYLGLEQTAEIIRSYQVQFIPGLLQTHDYARGVVILSHGEAPSEQIERHVELRMRRQHILYRPQTTRLWALIDEAALRRPVGGRAAMFRQLEHLIEVCELPNVTIQVLPFSMGGHAALGGPITLLRLPEPIIPEFIYLEQLNTAVYPGSAGDIDFYRHILNRLAVQAPPPKAAPAIMSELLKDL